MNTHKLYWLFAGFFGALVGVLVWIFWHAGYRIAWNIPIDMNATGVVVSMMAALFGGCSAMLAVITIRQQNRQTFEQEFSSRLKRQASITEALHADGRIITNSPNPIDISLDGARVFELMYWQFYYLSKSMVGVSYEWERDVIGFENVISNIGEEDWHYSPEWCVAKQQESIAKLKTCFVLHEYGKQGFVLIKWKESYDLVLPRWSSKLTSYYRHLLTTLTFLDRQCHRWNISKEDKDEYLMEFVSNMTVFEQTMLFYYFITHRGESKTLEQNKDVLFRNVSHLLDQSHLAQAL